jgi:secreted PhoX family phosphatase
MGDDARNEYMYKFVSAAKWDAADASPKNRMAAGDKYLDKGIHAVAEGAKAMSLEEVYQHLEIDELVNPMEMKEADEPSAIQRLVKELDEVLLDSEICLKALRGNELPIR